MRQHDEAYESAMHTGGPEDWLVALDATAMICHTYLGNFDQARQLATAITTAAVTPAPARDVLCAGVQSQVAVAEGALGDADVLSGDAIAAARRHRFERHYFTVWALRTRALLALEWRQLDTAAQLTEDILGRLNGGRPILDYLAQLDRARIWAARGSVEEALASLPAARTALRSQTSSLLTFADELEGRCRLALGDFNGAAAMANRLPADRQVVLSAMLAVAAGDPRGAAESLRTVAATPTTIRSDLELRLLWATIALLQGSHDSSARVKEALAVVDRHGFVQTVLDTAPQLVEHLLAESDRYPLTAHLSTLLAAGSEARKRAVRRPPPGRLPDPLTDAELRVLERLPERLTYVDIASELHLSLNTVKTHLRHTYMKLGVSSRSAAVKRAVSLGFV